VKIRLSLQAKLDLKLVAEFSALTDGGMDIISNGYIGSDVVNMEGGII
jgi:hypothetical protein